MQKSTKQLLVILVLITVFLFVGCNRAETDCIPDDYATLPTEPPEINGLPTNLRVTAVSAAAWHTLAILEDGSLWGWGTHLFVSPDNWSSGEVSLPVQILDNIVLASAGEYHSLALSADGTLWAWGGNTWGQLGDGTLEARPEPVTVLENVVYAAVAPVLSNSNVGYTARSFAITADGILWAWGANGGFDISGYLGDGTASGTSYSDGVWTEIDNNRHAPVQIMENVVSVTPTLDGGFATTADGALWWWGSTRIYNEADSFWELGEPQLYPIMIADYADAPTFRHGWFDYQIDEDGTLWTWGENSLPDEYGWGAFPLVGDGTTEPRAEPVRIKENIASVTVVGDAVFALGLDGNLWAWGLNSIGQLGDGTTEMRLAPVQILENVLYITANSYLDHGRVSFINTFVITADGALWAWGGHSFGAGLLGDGTEEHWLSPVHIMGGSGV